MKKALLIAVVLAITTGFVFARGGEDAVKVNNKFVLYTTCNDAQLEAVIPPFKEKHPDLDIEIVTGSAGELIAKLKAEKDNPQADAVLGALTYEGVRGFQSFIEPYQCPSTKEYPSYAIDPTGYLNPYAMQISVFVVNKDLEKKLGFEITGYDSLLDPRLKGKIINANPTSSSSAWGHLVNMEEIYGGLGSTGFTDYLKAFITNLKGVTTNSSSTVYKQVMNGEYVVGLSYESAITQQLLDGAKNIRIVYPKEGSIVGMFATAVVANAKNMEIAKDFVEWIVSKKGQQIYAEKYGGRPVHPKVPINPILAPLDTIHLLDYNKAFVGENTTKIKDAWTKTWASLN